MYFRLNLHDLETLCVLFEYRCFESIVGYFTRGRRALSFVNTLRIELAPLKYADLR